MSSATTGARPARTGWPREGRPGLPLRVDRARRGRQPRARPRRRAAPPRPRRRRAGAGRAARPRGRVRRPRRLAGGPLQRLGGPHRDRPPHPRQGPPGAGRRRLRPAPRPRAAVAERRAAGGRPVPPPGGGHLPRQPGPLARAHGRLAGRIAVSPSARDTWQGQFGGSMVVIPNGVAPEFFACPEPLPGWKGTGPTVLFVGRLEPRKGLAYLVRAFLRLKPAFPGLRLLVVGRDDKRQQERAMAVVPARLRPDLVFVGAVPQADLPSYYASADVFCAPSLGGESFGIVLAEAMAVGLPVVCSDIGGYRDVVRDGSEGLLVPPRDPEALATALGGLLDNPARRAAMGAAARGAAGRYAWQVVAAEVAEVYQAARSG